MDAVRVAYWGSCGPNSPSWTTENHVAASLESLGHHVTRMQEGEVRATDMPDVAAGHDLMLWTQTMSLAGSGGTREDRIQALARLRELGIPSVGFHLDLWYGLRRAAESGPPSGEAFWHCDHVFTADGGHAEDFARDGVNHHWSPPAVLAAECEPGTYRPEFAADVVFVGSHLGHYHRESRHRRALTSHLRRRRDVSFWPRPDRSFNVDGIDTHQVRGVALRDLYASARIVVGDSCLAGTGASHYLSDRIPETLGRGGFLLHPHTPGVTDGTLFTDGEHLVCYEPYNFRQLDRLIDHYLADESERMAIAENGRAHVLAEHTYAHRMQRVIDVVLG